MAPTLIAGLPANAGSAFQLGQLYASGGSVNLSASSLLGSGMITAYGAPIINIQNGTTASLILAGGAYIPDTAVGQINFIGAAGAAQVPSTLTRNQPISATALPTIAINNSYDTGFDGAYGPALLITGDIVNVAGLATINNTSGSYGLAANLVAQQVNITIPNGAVAVSANDPSGLYLAGGSPFSEWASYMIFPGGNPRSGTPNGDVAAAYLANTLYPNAGNGDQLNHLLYQVSGSTITSSTIFFGGCTPGVGGGDGVGCQPYDTGYGGFAAGSVDNSKAYGFLGNTSNNNNASLPYVTYYSLSKVATSYSSANLSGSQNSNQIYGGQVAIKANIIDINGTITAGRTTNWSVYLPSSLIDPVITTQTPVYAYGCAGFLNCGYNIVGYDTNYSGGAISIFKAQYDVAVLSNPATNALLTVNVGRDGSIAAVYNAATNQISLANVNASSGGSNVLLDGKIISTNTLGRIHVNGGYGNVSITNETGLGLVINGINTGNSAAATALTSTVKIVDRLKAEATNTATYLYSPATGTIRQYITSNGANPDSSSCLAGNCTTINASSTSYTPLQGTRFQWQLMAGITRDPSNLISAHWQFTTGTAANPWLYVTAGGGTSTTPSGTLLTGQSASLPVFQETITGQVLSQQNQAYAYNGCDPGGTCNYGFIQNYTHLDNDNHTVYQASWTYGYVIRGLLYLTQSVKSDNQFQVDFGGNASGTLNVVSNGSVIFANSIINPSGSLTINASASATTSGSITQTSTTPILTGSLDATAAGSIGTTAAPLNVTLTAGATPGTLSARAGSDGVNLKLNSGATLGTVSSGNATSGFGDVSITATGDLLAGSNEQVSGRNITLISSGGSVGALTSPLNISANATPLTGGGYQGGVVNVAAHGDIALTQNAASALYPGDLLIGLIASGSGDVQLNVPHGQILDASGQTAAQALSPSQVSAIAQALRLTPLDGSNAAALAVITGFENTVNRDLADYTRLVALGLMQNGLFVLDAASLEAYRALAAAALGLVGRSATDAETQTYANGLYQSYVADFTRAYGSGWRTNAAITSYSAYAGLIASGTLINGAFTLTAESIAIYRDGATAALGLVGRSATDAETRAYAAGLYTTLKTQVTYSATPGVAFSLLNASGSLESGTFVLTNTGLLSYASQALTATNYGAFRNLLSNGTLSSGTFALTSDGVTATAAGALSQDYLNFQNLTTYGTVLNGTLTLNAAGIAYFRQSASTTLNPNPTDAQVQTFANSLYQSYAQTINTAENAQYQNLLQSISQSASASYASLANQVWSTYCVAFNTSCGATFRSQFLSNGNSVMNYAYLIGGTDSAKLRALVALGSVTNGVFTLNAANVAGYASQGLSAADFASFTNLLANGTVTAGALTLNAAGLVTFAQSPLTANYQTFQALSNGGGTQLGSYVFSNSGVQAFAQSGLSSAYQGYQTLVANGTFANGLFTLTANGITAYRSIAASALGITTPTDAQVQAYANQQYQNSVFAAGNATYQQYSQTIATGAQSQLQTLLGIVRVFASNNFYQSGYLPSNSDQLLIENYAQSALSPASYAVLQSLINNGTFDATGSFTLNTTPAAVAAVSGIVLGSSDNLIFQTLLSRGVVANNQFVYSATGAVAAFQQLAAAGTVSAGAFQLNAGNVSGYATTALGAVGLQRLLASGTVTGTTLMLNDPGVLYYAPAALSSVNYATFSGLIASGNGEVVGGVLDLTANGISAFRAMATASLGHAATDAEVRTYANGQYQSFATAIQTYANSQYQSYIPTFQNAASTQYQAYATQIQNYYAAQANNGGCGFSGNCPPVTPLAVSDLATYMQSHLGDLNYTQADVTALQTLISNGVVQNGVYTLTATGIAAAFADPTQVAAKAQIFQTIASGGSLQNGAFVLNNAGLLAVAPVAATNAAAGSGGTDDEAYRIIAQHLAPASTVNNIVLDFAGINQLANLWGLSNSSNALYARISTIQGGYTQWVQAYAAQTYASGVSAIQGTAYAQYQSYVAPITTYGNAQYQSLVQTVQMVANSQYDAATRTIQAYGNAQYQALTGNGTVTPQATQAVLDLIANSVYTDGQIVAALNRSALQPAATTVGTNGNANITGRNITLTTSASIGSLAPNVVVNLSDLRNGTVTADQQAAIAAASAPGSVTFDVLVNGVLRAGQTLSQLGTALNSSDIISAQLAQISPVFVNASGVFNATAGTTVYVQATSALSAASTQLLASAGMSNTLPVATLAIGRINAGGDVTVLAPQNIVAALNTSNVPVNTSQIVTSGDLSIAAGGNLGTAINPLTFQIGGNLVSGSAGNNAWLQGLGGDIRVGRLSAGSSAVGGNAAVVGTASLTASAGSILSYLPGVAVSAANIVLNASGDVGSGTTPFQIQDNSSGSLSGVVNGMAWIYGSTLSTQLTPVVLYVGNFDAAGGLNLLTDADIRFTGIASSTNGAVSVRTLGATADIIMGAASAISAGTTITLTGASDIVLGRLQTTYNPASVSTVITISALGTITGNGDGQTNLVANGANDNVSLTGSSIGTALRRITLTAPLASVTAASGDIYLKAIGNLEATLLSATHGSVDIQGTGSLLLNSVLAGTATGASGAFTADTSTVGGLGITIGIATSSGTQALLAANDIAFSQLTTTGSTGDINATSDHGKIAGDTILANHSATLNASTTNSGASLTATNGLISLQAGGLIDWTTLRAGTTLTAASTGAGVTLGTATSVGTQTLLAANDIAFTQLTTTGSNGDINATSDRGKIAGDTILANHSTTLIASTTNSGASLTATNGLISLQAGGLIDWTTLRAGATLTAASTGAGVTLGTATSVGTQTLLAANDIAFTQLTTTGSNGDVNATSSNGAITGSSVFAKRSATLVAGTTIQGNSLTATTGSISLQALGLIDWATLGAGTTLAAISTNAGVTFGTVTSGGSQTLRANNDVTFVQLISNGIVGDVGNISATSDNGRIVGGSIVANGDLNLFGNGIVFAGVSSGADATLTSTGDIIGRSSTAVGDLAMSAGVAPGVTGTLKVDVTHAATTTLTATGALKIANLEVATGLKLASNDIDATITQTGGPDLPPLVLDLTGARGGVADLIALTLHATSVEFTRLSGTNVAINSSGPNIAIDNGYVAGRMAIATPNQLILLNNQSARPTGNASVQLFQPSLAFNLNLRGIALSTNSFVVDYQAGSNVTDYLGGLPYDGASLVRDFARTDRVGQGFSLQPSGDGARSTLFVTGAAPDRYLDIQAPKKDVRSAGQGPAVNVGE